MKMNRPAAVWLLSGAALFGATELPSITPQVTSLAPHGGMRGSEVLVKFRGSYLDGATAMRFTGNQIEGRVESSDFHAAQARVRIDADAEAGAHEFRLITPRGAYLGVFLVGTLPESAESEDNNRRERPQPIRLPALINGTADRADTDYFGFHAEAGQTVVFDIAATRLGSALDPVLTLFDERGREIGYCDDFYVFKDARLIHTFARAGDYTVLVSASFERSARDAEYRLLATSGPYAGSVLPLGARRGSSVVVRVKGWNLDRVDRVWLGRGLATGKVLQRSNTEVRVQLDVPASIAPGSYRMHVAAGPEEAPDPMRFEVGELPEVTAWPDSPAGKEHPVRVSAPVVVNGEIPDPDGNHLHRAQYVEFEAKAGGRYEFNVDAWKLGQRMDPVVTLFDEQWQRLAQEDDPAPSSFIHHPASHDPCLVYVFSKAGRYRLQVRDAAYEAGDGVSYRLTIRETTPDFQVDVRSPQITVFTGRTARLLAVVRRTGGVHIIEGFRIPASEIEQFRIIEKDGWNQPIQVTAFQLPAGVSAETVTAQPKNTIFKGNDGEELFVDGTIVEIPIRAASGAKPGLYEISVRARGSLEDREVERRGRVLFGSLHSRRGDPTQDQKLLLNVVDAPPLLWNSPSEFRISKGATDRLKIGLLRLDGNYPVAVEAKSAVNGWSVGRSVASAAAEELELPVTALAGARENPERLVLVATFEIGGRKVQVESPPIELRIKIETKP